MGPSDDTGILATARAVIAGWADEGRSGLLMYMSGGAFHGSEGACFGAQSVAQLPQHVDLAAWRGRVEAVFDQPADRPQASQRLPRVDHVEVDVGAVAGDDVAEVLLVSERQAGEVVEGIALGRFPEAVLVSPLTGQPGGVMSLAS